MLTMTDWHQAIAEAVAELLQKSDLVSPPVDALEIARSTGIVVAWDQSQAGRGRIKRVAGKPIIFLRPEDRPERLQWAAAHELGESLAWRVCRSLGMDGQDLTPRQREELANQLAKEILLPRLWFRRDSERLQYDLVRLKTRYSTASHELIAWRWLDLEPPAIVTLFDQGALTRRQGNSPPPAPGLTAIERDCWAQLRRTRLGTCFTDQRFKVRGWCVDFANWQREILYAVATSSQDEDSWEESEV